MGKILIFLIAISALVVSTALAGGSNVFMRCESCGRLLGKEAPESVLSRDPDFKKYHMFQVCQDCLNKKMNTRAQAAYAQVAFKYKWNSISHNLKESARESANGLRFR